MPAASIKLSDNRIALFQYDTNVEIELCNCTANELHFEYCTRDNTVAYCESKCLVKRTLTNGKCLIPDAALMYDGFLMVYAYDCNAGNPNTERYTRHAFRIEVIKREAPSDYIIPPDESDRIEEIKDRLAADENFIESITTDEDFIDAVAEEVLIEVYVSDTTLVINRS